MQIGCLYSGGDLSGNAVNKVRECQLRLSNIEAVGTIKSHSIKYKYMMFDSTAF